MCKNSEKIKELSWLEALKNFDFFTQKTWFLQTRSFCVMQNLIKLNLKNKNNQIIRNFELYPLNASITPI